MRQLTYYPIFQLSKAPTRRTSPVVPRQPSPDPTRKSPSPAAPKPPPPPTRKSSPSPTHQPSPVRHKSVITIMPSNR